MQVELKKVGRTFGNFCLYKVFSLYTKGKISGLSGVLFSSTARLEKNDMTMVLWMCNVTLKDRKSSDEFRDNLGFVNIRNCIQRRFGQRQLDNIYRSVRQVRILKNQ